MPHENGIVARLLREAKDDKLGISASILHSISELQQESTPVSTATAGKILGVSPATIRRWIRQGKITAATRRGKYLIPVSEVAALILLEKGSPFIIPTSVEFGPPVFSAGWDQASVLRYKPEEFDKQRIRDISAAVTQYLFDKDLSKPGRSWQDFIAVQVLLHQVVHDEVTRRIKEDGDAYIIAELRTVFVNFPHINLTKHEEKLVDKFIKEKTQGIDELKYSDLAGYVFRLKNVNMQPGKLRTRNNLRQVDTNRKKLLGIGQERLIGIVEGIIASLIAAGLFELLREALASLATRAPYTEAQIYEVESDVVRGMKTWHDACKDTLAALEGSHREIVLILVLHATTVAAVYGMNIPGNPLCRSGRE